MNSTNAYHRPAGLPVPDQRAFKKTRAVPIPKPSKREHSGENVDNLVGQVANVHLAGSPCFDDSPVKKNKSQMGQIGQLHKCIKEQVGAVLSYEQIESIADSVIFAFTPKEVSPQKKLYYVETKDSIVPFNILYNFSGRRAFVDLECGTVHQKDANAVIQITLSRDGESPPVVELIDATFKDVKEYLRTEK